MVVNQFLKAAPFEVAIEINMPVRLAKIFRYTNMVIFVFMSSISLYCNEMRYLSNAY